MRCYRYIRCFFAFLSACNLDKTNFGILSNFSIFPAVAGAVSSAIANPTDVLKVRMQVHGRGTDKIGLFGCFHEVYRNEGIAGLWKVTQFDEDCEQIFNIFGIM